MREVTPFVRRLFTTSRGDVFAAVVLACGAVSLIATYGGFTSEAWVVPLLALTTCASLGLRRRHATLGAAAIAAVCLLARAVGQLSAVNNGTGGDVLTALMIGIVFLLSYSVGETEELRPSVLGLALLVFAVNVIGTVFNPLASVIAIGPWVAGRVVASRRQMNEQLESRRRELEAERELFARESVRYERSRIARELHDIVAHCVSVMVIQANAGQRLLPADPARAIAALDSITEAAHQADEEVGRLVELLGAEPPAGDSARLQFVERLVRQARATGIEISCRFEGSRDRLSPVAADAAFRVVQEGITNALKHAPGAPIDVTVAEAVDHIEVEIVNASGTAEKSGLEEAGGGHGLDGMRERVAACGGWLTAAPMANGGWRIAVSLPTESR